MWPTIQHLLIKTKRNKVKKYIIKNALNGSVTIVNAKGRIDALNKGRKVFNEPNRSPQPVIIVR